VLSKSGPATSGGNIDLREAFATIKKHYNSNKIGLAYRSVRFPGVPGSPGGVPGSPQGQFSEGSEKVRESSRKLEKVGEG